MRADLVPDVTAAKMIAAKTIGENPISVQRFSVGSHHYVFEATFESSPPVVVRIAAEHSRSAMIGASVLSHRLRPLGVPLPKILAEDLCADYAYIVLERLRGRDLRDVIGSLNPKKRRPIAERIVDAQNIVSRIPSAGRYGYAVEGAHAPHERWSQVLDDSIARSRERISSAQLFDVKLVFTVADLVDQMRPALDGLPSIPFLHDTTIKNVIVTDTGTFSGIVDVDDLCFGDPRYVGALTLAALKSAQLPTDYVSEWMKLAGFQDDRLFRLYVALFILDFISEQGQSFNQNPLPASADGGRHLLELYSDCLRDVGARRG
jgi:aminoglycoside phosphotransferase